jgi:hypothetical protein
MPMLFLDNFMFFLMVHFASAVDLILCTGKWIKLFTEAVLSFNFRFQHMSVFLLENQMNES